MSEIWYNLPMKNEEKKHLNIDNIETKSKEEIVSFFLSAQEEVLEKDKKIESLNQDLQSTNNDLKIANETIKYLHDKLYGKKTEKTEALKGQLGLFDEVELSADETLEEYDIEEEIEEASTGKKTKKGRKKITKSNPDLEVKVIEHIMQDCVDEAYEVIGSKETEKYIFKPAELYIQKDVYPVYRKENEDGTDDIQTLYQGYDFLSKSSATPRLVASILNDKYAKALPLYRIEESFKNMGANISRQIMSKWVIKSSDQYLKPLYDLMKEDLIQKDIIHADETTVQVINHQDDSTNIKSYMWLYRSGVHDDKIIIYEYQPGRGAHHPETFLKDFKGYLQTDGYSAYKKIDDVIQVGCLAHGRRKIKEALQVMKTKTEGTQIASQIFKTMNTIFSEDKNIQKMEREVSELQAHRLEILTPLFEQLEKELKDAQSKILPKSNLGKAITYNLNQFESFKNVLKDPRLELTNNIAERAIKPFVIGRKNWLFSNTTKGAKYSAIAYSLIQSAKDNGLKVEAYLTYVFETMANLGDDITQNDLKQIVPHSKSLPDKLYSKKLK